MWRPRWLLVLALAPLVAGLMSPIAPRPASAAPPKSPAEKAARPPAISREALLRGLDPRARALSEGRLTTALPGARKAVLSLDPALDAFVSKLLQKNDVPHAGVVAMDPATGRVLAYVSHGQQGVRGPDRVLDASAPAASVFKVVTATALLAEGVTPSRSVCYHGGSQRLSMGELVDNPKRDTACASLTGALGFSINAVFGKLALQFLDPKRLARQAAAYGFGERLPFDVPTEPSVLDVPREKLEFARTAAGFWHTSLSPLHAAAMAASIANGGRMMRPELVDRVVDAQGKVVYASAPALHRKVTEPRTAQQLGIMLRATVAQGTSRRSFHDSRGRPVLPGIAVAGKTGTLSEERPYRGYTWWMGFAPADRPRIALGVLVVNSPNWRIKASQVAAETLRHYLVDAPRAAGGSGLAQR
ncbi:MAG: penicillin-binding transpeptidase domain-containing protein [Polyangiales bacterium]